MRQANGRSKIREYFDRNGANQRNLLFNMEGLKDHHHFTDLSSTIIFFSANISNCGQTKVTTIGEIHPFFSEP